MIIKLNELPVLEHPRFKDGKGIYLSGTFSDEKVKIMLGCLPPGSSIGFHTHTDNCEVIICISGRGDVVLENGSEILLPGCAHYCPQGLGHSLENNSKEDLRFYAIVI